MARLLSADVRYIIGQAPQLDHMLVHVTLQRWLVASYDHTHSACHILPMCVHAFYFLGVILKSQLFLSDPDVEMKKKNKAEIMICLGG